MSPRWLVPDEGPGKRSLLEFQTRRDALRNVGDVPYPILCRAFIPP